MKKKQFNLFQQIFFKFCKEIILDYHMINKLMNEISFHIDPFSSLFYYRLENFFFENNIYYKYSEFILVLKKIISIYFYEDVISNYGTVKINDYIKKYNLNNFKNKIFKISNIHEFIEYYCYEYDGIYSPYALAFQWLQTEEKYNFWALKNARFRQKICLLLNTVPNGKLHKTWIYF